MFVPDNRWIEEAWKQETRKELNSTKDEIILTMQTKGKTVQFEEDMKLEEKILDREFKPIWKQVKKCFKKGIEVKRLKQYRKKEMQSEIFNKQGKKYNMWLEQNSTPGKSSAIMLMIDQIVETRAWKKIGGLTQNSSDCVRSKRQ